MSVSVCECVCHIWSMVLRIVISHEFSITSNIINFKWLTSFYYNKWKQIKLVSIFLPCHIEGMIFVKFLSKTAKYGVYTIIYSMNMNIKKIFGTLKNDYL